MSYKSLRDFIERLERDGRLVRVTQPVSTDLEMTEIQTRVLAEGGPALLFENAVRPDGTAYNMPVLTNLFGTVERVAWGMDREPAQLREVGETLAFLRQPEPPGGFREALSHLPLLKTVMAMKPKTVSSAPCQEVVLTGNEIDLSALPIQSCWPGEPAPLITWPLVVTQGPNPDGNKADAFNLGIYRMQVTGSDTTLMRWLKHRGGAQHYARWKNEKPEPLPAAVVIGADPGSILAAVTPVPDTLSEYQFAGLLRGKKLDLVDCKTVPLKVPAQAEIVLEGHVMLDEHGAEGPYGDHTGYYNAVEPFPIFPDQRHHDAAQSDLSLHIYRPPAGRAGHPRRSAQRGVHSTLPAAVPRDRRFLATARGLLLPDRRRLHQEGVSRPRQADHDGRVVLSPSVYLYEMGDRGRRGNRRPRLEGCDVGDLNPHGPGPRHHRH